MLTTDFETFRAFYRKEAKLSQYEVYFMIQNRQAINFYNVSLELLDH